MKPDIDHEHTDDVVCPNCGHESRDSWEFEDGCRYDCDECGAEFKVSTLQTVTYSTKLTSAPKEEVAK